ncbi:MAG: terminase family protein [Candidatus Bathyarchaeota archaeon]|nr:terminase family protein [Candidatus Bathyarchaeota archaeon]
MSKRLRSLREKRRSMASSATNCPTLPSDPVEFCRKWLGYEPYEYMHPFLRDESHFIAVLQARQTGKTFNGMAKLLYYAVRYPGSTIIISAPKYDQVKRIAFKHLHSHLNRMKARDPQLFRAVVGSKGLMRTIIRFRNGSEILAESPVPETIRGHSAKAVYLMEMNFIRDDEDLYTAVLFTLNTTDGYLIAESTPWNTDSVFHDIFHKEEYGAFSKHMLPYTEALPPNGPLTPSIVSMIEEQLRGDPSRWRREMLCEWTEDDDRWLPMSLITFCQDSSLSYRSAESKRRGQFFVGVDFGKKRDHSVVAVIELKDGHYYLRHCHRFMLDTTYGAVIGYVKRLQDNWSRLVSVNCDQTGVGEYIVEDMRRAGIRNVNGVTFTEGTKEAMATILKEKMRTVECGECGWMGYVENFDGSWRRSCPNDDSGISSVFHIPYDQDLFNDLNTPIYTLSKTGRIQFNHSSGTHDDMFWAIALSMKAYEKGGNIPLAVT